MTWTGSADRLTVQPVHRVGRPLIGSLRVQVPLSTRRGARRTAPTASNRGPPGSCTSQPFRSRPWAATIWVIVDRDGGDFARTRRLGLARLETAVRREITKRGGQKPCLRIVRKLFAALADPTGVLAHRRGALERVQLLLEDWADNQRRLADTEARMVASSTSWS
jgi:hypothetical protein